MEHSATDAPPVCHHCGTRCPDRTLAEDDRFFCCLGCQTVYGLLRAGGLDRYYEIESAPGTRVSAAAREAFTHLDDEDVRRRLLDFSDGAVARVTFRIPAIHCAACVWLLENLYRLDPAIGAARVHFPRKELALGFDETRAKLSDVVHLLHRLGYAPDVSLGSLDARPADPTARRLLLRLGVAGFAFGNIMLMSLPSYLGLTPASDGSLRRFFGMMSILLALPVLVYSASSYWQAAWRGVRGRILTIEFPIALGIAALFGQSVVEITTGASEGYLDSFAGLIFLLLCGQWFQHKTYASLSFERDYKAYFPLAARRREGATARSVPVTTLAVGDRVLVRNQELVPADSVLIGGPACIDYSFVTGESHPVPRASGDYLYAGGRQAGGEIELEIVKPVSQSYLTSLWNHEAFLKQREATLQNLTNRAGRRFTRIVIAVAIGTGLTWYALDPSQALRTFTSVLLVACPCALALTAPFALGSAQRLLGRNRLFLRNSNVVEDMARVDTLVFDKTGTLTLAGTDDGAFAGAPLSERERLALAALCRQSTHPASRRLAAALAAEAASAATPVGAPAAPTAFAEEPGRGWEGEAQGLRVRLGSAAFAGAADRPEPGPWLAIDGRMRGRFVLGNVYRRDVGALMQSLARRFRLAVLSGDQAHEEATLRGMFGADADLRFQQSPRDKLDYVRALQSAQGRAVLMVGDGLNDAGALRQSDVGIAVTEDVGLFSPASDAILDASRLPQMAAFLDFARASVRIVKVGFGLSLVYNAIGISIAATGHLSPLIAAVLMPISSFSVIGFALLATRWAAWRRGLGLVPA